MHWGNWKIVRENPEHDWQLFNITEDISETTNLAEEHDAIMRQLVNTFNLKKAEIQSYLELEAERLSAKKN